MINAVRSLPADIISQFIPSATALRSVEPSGSGYPFGGHLFAVIPSPPDDIYQVENALTRHFRALKIRQRKDDLSQLVDLVVIDIPLTTAFQLVKGPSFHIVIRFLYQRIEQADDKPILPPED